MMTTATFVYMHSPEVKTVIFAKSVSNSEVILDSSRVNRKMVYKVRLNYAVTFDLTRKIVLSLLTRAKSPQGVRGR